MTIKDVIDLVTNVGFPIAAYAAMFWYMTRKDKDHKEEVTALTTAIENNTLVIQKLTDKEG